MVGKVNEVKKDAGSFKHLILGQPKVGKTTLFRDFVIEQYGDSKFGLLLSIGDEEGYKLIDDLFVEETYTWSEFVATVDDLVENVKDSTYKMIGLDTIDELVEIATDEVMRMHFMRKGSKAESINSALGGWGAGQRMVVSIIKKQLGRLTKAGYGLFFIGHTKVKDFVEKDGEAYQMLTGNLDGKYQRFFAGYVDVIAVLYSEKEIEDGAISNATRWIYFRSDGYIDAGSRFPSVPMRVELSARNYIDTFNYGIKSAMSEKVTDEEFTRLAKEEEGERILSGLEYSKKEKTGNPELSEELKSPQDYIKHIGKIIKGFNNEMKKEVRISLEDDGIDIREYKNINDIETLKHILRVVSDVV